MDEFHIDNKISVLSYPDDIAQAGIWSVVRNIRIQYPFPLTKSVLFTAIFTAGRARKSAIFR